MKCFLADDCALKRLESPSLYQISTDELFELDEEAYDFLLGCSSKNGCEALESDFLNYCLGEGILQAKRPSRESRSTTIRPFNPSLRYLELQITRKCNLSCRHCFLGPSENTELPIKDIIQVLDDFQEMQGLRVLITGGEPVLHRDFRRLNDILPRYALRKVLFTNGTTISDSLLKDLNVEELQVSIDGLEEAHDSLRGRGSFKKAMRFIKKSRNAGLDVSISTMVHPKNLMDFDELERLLKTIGIRDWTVDIPCRKGRLKDNAEFSLSPHEAGIYFKYGYGNGLHGGDGNESFSCGYHLMAVMADGSCSKCAFYYENPIGQISEGLARCWQRIKHIPTKELDCDCEYIETCRGGCRYRAETLGSPLGKDFYRCSFYAKIKKEGG